ncbi:hypothetical protein C5167_015778 [Papaver somniferum]|uniref:Uncharacterized protein n=1 Tax=Papaver somniferum TaxID=3469 RepID=A0A4Y7JA44_PAPSO|nr:hypothetical protein C5167_015778 [Papaver somniferum]
MKHSRYNFLLIMRQYALLLAKYLAMQTRPGIGLLDRCAMLQIFYGILVIPIVAELPPKDGAIEVILEDYHRRASSLLSIATMSACCQVSIPLGLQALYNKMQATIRVDPTAKKTEKAAPTMHKRPFGSLQVENQMQLVFGDGEAKPTVQGSKRCICDNRWTDLTQSEVQKYAGIIVGI